MQTMAPEHRDVDLLGHDPMEPAPPEGVFQALGVMAKDEGNDAVDGNDDDDELIRQRARDLLLGGGGGGGGGGKGGKGGNAIVVEDEEFGKGVDGTPDEALTPRFSPKGKFVGYESRNVEDRGVADIFFNGTPRDVKDAFRHSARCRRALVGLSILLFAVAISLAFFFVGDLIGMAIHNKEQQSLANAESSVAEGEGKVHTHPQMHHTRNPNHPTHSSSVAPGQSPSGATPDPTWKGEPILPSSYTVTIDPAALATIERSEPDNAFAGLQELGVERDERVSFARFDLSRQPMNETVVRAALLLYLKSHDDVDEGGTRVSVDLLPNAGGWEENQVTWNKPPDSTDAVTVNTFLWAGAMGDVELHLIEVDVTSSIVNGRVTAAKEATFRLSTETGGFLFFAGRRWNYGEGVPELAISFE